MASQKCVSAIELDNDALVAITNKALGYPRKGTHVGGGIHVPMPATWDGQGTAPPGWTKQVTANWVVSPTESYVPITDALAAQLQAAPAQALLSAPEQLTLATALGARASVDPEGKGAIPKASAAEAAAIEEAEVTKP